MMREIKFRAWFKGEKYPIDEHNIEDYEKPRMIYDVQNAYDGRGIKDEHNGFGYISCFSEFFDEDNFIVMQFTGLKDKNGKEIYEGDIYHQGDSKITYTVVWHDTGLIGKQNGSSSYAGLSHWQDRIEVIGNIYEHSHLLEGK